MASILFPESLPGVSRFSVRPVEILTSPRDGTPAQFRQRSGEQRFLADVAWRFLEEDFQLFRNWWVDELTYGHRWWFVTLPLTGAGEFVAARFHSRYKSQAIGHRAFEVTATLEVNRNRRYVAPPDLTYTSQLYPAIVFEELERAFALQWGRLLEWPLDELDREFELVSGSNEQTLFQHFAQVGSSEVRDGATTPADFDSLDSLASLVSGSLVQTFFPRYLSVGTSEARDGEVEPNGGYDSLDRGITLVSGSNVQTFFPLYYTHPPEDNLDRTHGIIVSGTLA